jgi:hypothetical protein
MNIPCRVLKVQEENCENLFRWSVVKCSRPEHHVDKNLKYFSVLLFLNFVNENLYLFNNQKHQNPLLSTELSAFHLH